MKLKRCKINFYVIISILIFLTHILFSDNTFNSKYFLGISFQGKNLTIASKKGLIKKINIANKKINKLIDLKIKNLIYISRNGKYIVQKIETNQQNVIIKIFETTNGNEVLKIKPGKYRAINAIDISNNGKYIALGGITGGGGFTVLTIYSLKNGAIVKDFTKPGRPGVGISGNISCLRFTPDNEKIIALRGDKMEFYSVKKKKMIRRIFAMFGTINILSNISKNYFITHSKREAVIWNLKKFSLHRRHLHAGGIINCVGLSSKGNYLIISNNKNITYVYHITTGKIFKKFKLNKTPHKITYSESISRLVFCTKDGKVLYKNI